MELTDRQVQNFWAKVEKTDDCWNWTAAKSGTDIKGWYGMFGVWPRGPMLAHRVSYLLAHGELPAEGLTIDHLCRNTLCVNPDHLEAVTRAENVSRAALHWKPDRGKAGWTHCPNGHEYTAENIWVNNLGHRRCRTCRRRYNREYWRKTYGKKAAY